MRRTWWRHLAAALVVASSAEATVVGGGGARTGDCIAVIDAAANSPAPPRAPRNVDCVDGDPCDADGLRNGRCTFDLRLCVNSTAIAGCTPVRADALVVDHALDNGDRRFDPEFQALQQRADLLGFPDVESLDRCTLQSSVTVTLKPPRAKGSWSKATKRVTYTARGFATGRLLADKDKIKFTCRPEGDGVYGPRDLYAGTFDRIAQQLFAPTCAVSGCHDSETHQRDMILLPGAAYSQIVGVTPVTPAAAADGLLRVFPGDETKSLLWRKVTGALPPGYGAQMPFGGPAVPSAMTDIIRLWILDGAPQTGWVAGTDQ